MKYASSNKRINLLAQKWQEGRITAHEKEEFEAWYTSFDNVLEVNTTETREQAELRLYQSIADKAEINVLRHSALWPRIVTVAAAVVAIVVGGWFYQPVLNWFQNHSDAMPSRTAGRYLMNDIAPGKNTATLTLANGKQIKLSDVANGEIAEQAGVTITKTADGQLIYDLSSRANTKDLDLSKVGMTNLTNTLSTSKGETYRVKLPDGSSVWLNAVSSLKYAANFATLQKRIVQLQGEAYFEVSKDKSRPFIVESNGQEVKVLGTHFNINSYPENKVIRTTLLEGSVQVSSSLIGKTKQSLILKPNQQLLLTTKSIDIKEVPTEDVIAWKNGAFAFNEESLESIMQSLSRWYGVEVVYEAGVRKTELYSGSVSRFDNISRVLSKLELTKGMHFRIEGRVITVTK